MRAYVEIAECFLQGLKPGSEASLMSDLKVRPPEEKSAERSPAARSPGSSPPLRKAKSRSLTPLAKGASGFGMTGREAHCRSARTARYLVIGIREIFELTALIFVVVLVVASGAHGVSGHVIGHGSA